MLRRGHLKRSCKPCDLATLKFFSTSDSSAFVRSYFSHKVNHRREGTQQHMGRGVSPSAAMPHLSGSHSNKEHLRFQTRRDYPFRISVCGTSIDQLGSSLWTFGTRRLRFLTTSRQFACRAADKPRLFQ